MNDPINPQVAAVRPGAVASTFVHEIVQMSNEIAAGRLFMQDVNEWLNTTGFRAAFENFRAQKVAARAAARDSSVSPDRVARVDDTKPADVDG